MKSYQTKNKLSELTKAEDKELAADIFDYSIDEFNNKSSKKTKSPNGSSSLTIKKNIDDKGQK